MKNSREAYGAAGSTNLLLFDPDKLDLVTDDTSPLYDPRVHLALDEKMVRSIFHHNVKEPIIVTKNPETGTTQVVAGRQRVKNAREANRRRRDQGLDPHQIPGVIERWIGKGYALTATMVIENEIREEDTVLGRAGKMARLTSFGQSEEQIGILFGCTEETVRNHLALLDTTQATRDAIEAGQISVTNARKLATLAPDAQREAVAEIISKGEGLKPRAKAKAQREAVADATGKPTGLKMRTRKEVERQIEELNKRPETNAIILQWMRWFLGEA